jgi:hypothetical protein
MNKGNTKNVFKVPFDYFDQFEGEILSTIKNREFNKNGFIIPSGYFENFETKLIKKFINLEKEKKWYGLVACLTLFIALSVIYSEKTKNNFNKVELLSSYNEQIRIPPYKAYEVYSLINNKIVNPRIIAEETTDLDLDQTYYNNTYKTIYYEEIDY